MDERIRLSQTLSKIGDRPWPIKAKMLEKLFAFRKWDSHNFLQMMDYTKLQTYYSQGYFAFVNRAGQVQYAVYKLDRLLAIEPEDYPKYVLISRTDFEFYLNQYTAQDNTQNAITYLTKYTNFYSAKNINYEKMVVGFCIIFFALMHFSINLFFCINHLLYLLQNLFKSALFYFGAGQQLRDNSHQLNWERIQYPIYSILIPLHQEEYKAAAILRAIDKLDYPKDKLDVKLILEEDDIMTNKAVMALEIPDYVQVIQVKHSLPKTKPKALNYTMPYVRGEYLTIYDAEDEPDPQQLKKALAAFQDLPEDYACVQAELNFYNVKNNMLTRMFSLEYSIWFGNLLSGLSWLNLPVTLGGTSNHFKVDVLRQIGLWDVYNVTEDADLGIRLYLSGHRVHMIESVTMEEAPEKVGDWIFQRSRWIKGFIQTFAVFMKNQKSIDFSGIIAIIIFVGLSTYSFLFLPWLILMSLTKLDYYIYLLFWLNSFMSFIYVYTTTYIAASRPRNIIKYDGFLDRLSIILFPLYLTLHTIAAYRAIFEIIKSPFKWNKTPHGNQIVEEISDFAQEGPDSQISALEKTN